MPLRLLVAVIIVLAALIVLFLFLLATDTALSVWHYLKDAPAWLQLSYFIVLIALPLATLALFWAWFRPARRSTPKARPSVSDLSALKDELLASSRTGVDIDPALAEIAEQRRRMSSGEIYIAIYGEVSSGKSSLVRAMLPGAVVETDPRAGTTLAVQHFEWTGASSDRIVIVDLPGFNFAGNQEAMEETRRAHLVIFLCDGDLTASQVDPLRYLMGLGKPVVLALNKTDQFSPSEQNQLRLSLANRSGLATEDIVLISAGGKEEVVRLLGEGMERQETRERKPQIDALLLAVQRHLDENRELMASLQDTAVLLLASEKLDQAKSQHRAQLADELVSKYSKRAVIGALAAVAPGSDIVIQGVLATQLIRELSALYEVPVKEMEIETFLRAAGSKLKNMTAITLAIAGNALKAFPGLGTISGGLVHAVAYGMIFDSLGRAAATTLASRGALRAYPAAEVFEDLLNEHLESGAVRFARLALNRKDK